MTRYASGEEPMVGDTVTVYGEQYTIAQVAGSVLVSKGDTWLGTATCTFIRRGETQSPAQRPMSVDPVYFGDDPCPSKSPQLLLGCMLARGHSGKCHHEQGGTSYRWERDEPVLVEPLVAQTCKCGRRSMLCDAEGRCPDCMKAEAERCESDHNFDPSTNWCLYCGHGKSLIEDTGATCEELRHVGAGVHGSIESFSRWLAMPTMGERFEEFKVECLEALEGYDNVTAKFDVGKYGPTVWLSAPGMYETPLTPCSDYYDAVTRHLDDMAERAGRAYLRGWPLTPGSKR